MSFGFSSCSKPVCEKHFLVGERGDKSLEEISKVEDLSIGGKGNLPELETVGSAADIMGESPQKGEEKSSRGGGRGCGGKKKGAKSKKEREGDDYDDEGDYDDDDYDEDEEGTSEVKVEVVFQGRKRRLPTNLRFFRACFNSGQHQHQSSPAYQSLSLL